MDRTNCASIYPYQTRNYVGITRYLDLELCNIYVIYIYNFTRGSNDCLFPCSVLTVRRLINFIIASRGELDTIMERIIDGKIFERKYGGRFPHSSHGLESARARISPLSPLSRLLYLRYVIVKYGVFNTSRLALKRI